jgi:carbon monoxide dehydrogenase subunit G
MTWSAEMVVAASSDEVLSFLLRVAALPSWNPAISSIKTDDQITQVGRQYSARIRGIIHAKLTISSVTQSEVNYTLTGRGFREEGSWGMQPITASHTIVTHSFKHRGAVLGLMRGAFDEVAAWRVARLGNCFAKA